MKINVEATKAVHKEIERWEKVRKELCKVFRFQSEFEKAQKQRRSKERID